MSADVVTCSPRDRAADLARVMTDRRIRHLPVCDERGLIGIVSIGDLVKTRIDQLEREREQLTSYITAADSLRTRLGQLHQRVVGVLDDRALGRQQRQAGRREEPRHADLALVEGLVPRRPGRPSTVERDLRPAQQQPAHQQVAQRHQQPDAVLAGPVHARRVLGRPRRRGR